MGLDALMLLATLVGGLFGWSGDKSTVVLDGMEVQVHWSDGDSFRITSGALSGTKTRLAGYNTLEDYGAVQSWGEWTEAELAKVNDKATEHARKGRWNCKSSGEKDGYQRLLVRCDDLIISMVAEGYAHLFLFDDKAPDGALEAQKKAIADKKGMWAKGAPQAVVTSLHSSTEPGGKGGYNRVADLETGVARKIEHQEIYSVCQKVCLLGACMLYVPYDQRYGDNRAACLRSKFGEKD